MSGLATESASVIGSDVYIRHQKLSGRLCGVGLRRKGVRRKQTKASGSQGRGGSGNVL